MGRRKFLVQGKKVLSTKHPHHLLWGSFIITGSHYREEIIFYDGEKKGYVILP